LAAQAFVPESFKDPQRTFHINIDGTDNVLRAVAALGIKPRIMIAGSSEEYGLVSSKECPINEDQPLRPQSPYAISKIAADMLGGWYANSSGLHVVRTRAFNHSGPGRGEMYVTSSFAKQVAKIEIEGGVLKHGNLEAVRDITDVRDIVRAYRAAIRLEPDVYNIGTGKGIKIADVLKILTKAAKKKIKTELDPALMRKTDVPLLICDSTKFRKLTHWKPTIKIEKTLKDLLDHWRKELKKV